MEQPYQGSHVQQVELYDQAYYDAQNVYKYVYEQLQQQQVHEVIALTIVQLKYKVSISNCNWLRKNFVSRTINTQQLKAQLSKAKIELTGLQDGLTQLQQLLYYNTSPQQLKNQMSQIKDQQVSLQNALNQMAMITGW